MPTRADALPPPEATPPALWRGAAAADGPGGEAFPGVAGLVPGRVHETCGPARRTLALLHAGAAGGPVIWIAPAWEAERLHAPGLARLVDPGRLIFVACPRAEDLLWCAEEALRRMAAGGDGEEQGAAVVVDCTAPPGLTPVRRLHLAAGGAGSGPGGGWGGGRGRAPLGILLTPGAGGAPGVESRWHIAPAHGPNRSAWRLERRRARGADPATWHLVAVRGRLRLETAADSARGLAPGNGACHRAEPG